MIRTRTIEPEKPIAEPTIRTGKRGRPKSAVAKELVTIRLDARVLAVYRAKDKGWQKRLNDDLVRLCGL